MVYSALRSPDGTIVIIAKDRVQELSEQLGPTEEVMTFSGEPFIVVYTRREAF